MEIVVLIVLFLVGTVGGAIQALRYFERRHTASRKTSGTDKREPD